MAKLSKSEHNLIRVATATTVCLAVFLLFIYIPSYRSMTKLKSRVDKSDLLLSEIRKTIGEYATLDHGISALRQQAEALSGKYVDQKDISFVLNLLNELANASGVRIISMTPQALTALTDKGAPVYYDKVCLKQPVKLILEGRYEQFAEYLYSLEQSPSGIFTINSFSISKDKSIAPDLKLDLVVGVYVFGDKKSVRKP